MATLSDALKEAYASAPVDQVIVHTMEIRHSSFKTPEGDETSIWAVRDYYPFKGKLESTHPFAANQMVRFEPISFNFILPEKGEGMVPEMRITLDNIGAQVTRYLDEAVGSLDKITMVYRPYVWDDNTGTILEDGCRVVSTAAPGLGYPEMDPPIEMAIMRVSVGVDAIEAIARYEDLLNFNFPQERYVSWRFPGLSKG